MTPKFAIVVSTWFRLKAPGRRILLATCGPVLSFRIRPTCSRQYQMTSIADRIAGPPLAGEADAIALAPVASLPAVTLPAGGERELRLDLFRGLALWLIFLDHLPP